MSEVEAELLESGPAIPPPENIFMRRYAATAAVVGDYIYFVGGYVVEMTQHPEVQKVYYPMNSTLSLPLTESWTNKTANLSQSSAGARPWSHSPALWPTSEGFYSYGGIANEGLGDISDELHVRDTFWYFLADGNGGGQWHSRPAPPFLDRYEVNEPACSSGHHVGYCSGGNYVALDSGPESLPPQITSYDWQTNSWRSEPAGSPHFLRMSGGSETIPDVGPKGLFMSFGGYTAEEVTGDRNMVLMDTISIYEPESTTWYQQPTAGTIPPERTYFCSTLAKSTGGSYELFIYGGDPLTGNSPLDDVYILTIPGFQWFSVDQPGELDPGQRTQHTCSLVGNRQALVFGGIGTHVGEHVYDVDNWSQGIGVFDLSALKWTDSYDAEASAYESPDAITDWYRTADIDDVDWASDDLRALFQAGTPSPFLSSGPSGNSSTSDDSPTTDNPAAHHNSSTSPGTIAGSVIGSIAGLGLLLSVLWILYRRRHGLPSFGPRDARGGTTEDKYRVDGELGTQGLKNELDGNQQCELDGVQQGELEGEPARHELATAAELRELPGEPGPETKDSPEQESCPSTPRQHMRYELE